MDGGLLHLLIQIIVVGLDRASFMPLSFGY